VEALDEPAAVQLLGEKMVFDVTEEDDFE